MDIDDEIRALGLRTYNDGTRIRVPTRGASRLLAALKASSEWRRVPMYVRLAARRSMKGAPVIFERIGG